MTASGKWKRASDQVILKLPRPSIVIGMTQIFLKKVKNAPVMVMDKHGDDVVTAAHNDSGMEVARHEINQSFEVGQYNETTDELIFSSTEVIQHKNIIPLSAKRLMKRVELIQLAAAKQK